MSQEDKPKKYYRKIIHISAADTPNVRLGLAQEAAGEIPTGEINGEPYTKGVLTWQEYQYRRRTWDKVHQSIGLDGKFWEGGETLLYPPQWLNRAERLYLYFKGRHRIARGMGIDAGEGWANTSIYVVDEIGVIDRISQKTPNTNDVIRLTLDMMHKHKLPSDKVLFDRGGGGKQHADRLREMGYPVRTQAFNDKPSSVDRRTRTPFKERVDVKEKKSAYLNVRAEMYGELRVLLDPGIDLLDYDSQIAWQEVSTEKQRNLSEIKGFALDPDDYRLREQLAPVPFLQDGEGRMYLPPKNKKNPNSNERTMIDIIGYSPDEADALVLAIHAMQMASHQSKAGAI